MFRPLWIVAIGAALLACGSPPSPCAAGTCGGCCDPAGVCQSGLSNDACGATGSACAACGAGLVCQVGACSDLGGGGGTGGGGTGGGGAGGGAGGGGVAGGTGGAGGGMTGTFTVSGRVTYDFVPATYDTAAETGTLDFASAAQRPVRNGTVRVVEGTAVLASTSSAADGTYALQFTSTGAAPLSVQAVARTTSPSIQVQDNTSNSAVWAISAPVPVDGGTVDLHATHGWSATHYVPAQRTAAPFALLDSAYTAATAVAAARPSLSFPPLKINWSPKNTTATNGPVSQGFLGTSYFDGQNNQIYVVGKDGVDTDEYDNHVVVHEWGHFFQFNFSRDDSIGGDHVSGDVLDPRDSFSEGWGSAAAGMLLGDPLYVDTYFSSGSVESWGFDVETEPSPTDDPRPGGFSEASVMRLLYDAFDATNERASDRLSVGLGTIVDVLTGAHKTTDALTTIASFVTGLRAQPGVSTTDLDALLAGYSLGAITSPFGDGDTALRAMFATVSSLPLNATVSLDGRVAYNFAAQNKYWVLTGNGAQLTVTADSTQDVAIAAYQRGQEVGFSDDGTTGTESFSFDSTSGATYVVVLTGYGETSSPYPSTLSITSP